MRWPDLHHRVLPPFLFAILMATTLPAAPAPAPATSPLSAASNAATADISTNNQKIDIPVPIGEKVKGIKIPQYDEAGKMTMCLTAETAQKLNENQVELGKLKVQFNEKEDKEIVVEIPHSILDLESKVLTADSQTTIHREDFEIVGESAVFDTLARQGSFKGHVHASFLNGTPMGESLVPPISNAKP